MPAPIRCIGDSLTRGAVVIEEAWPAQVERALGRPVLNEGIPGQTSTQIAARVGAVPARLQLEGGLIPAEGPVVGRHAEPDLLGHKHKGGIRGALEGVAGWLVHAKRGPYTFVRDAPGPQVPCPEGAMFVAERPACSVAVLWMGENDVLNGVGRGVVAANLAACLKALQPEEGRFVVLGLFAGSGEEAGTRRHRLKLELNAELARAYPGRVLDVWVPLMAAADPASAEDAADLQKGRTPRSLREDKIHLAPAGEAVIARLVEGFIRSRGW